MKDSYNLSDDLIVRFFVKAKLYRYLYYKFLKRICQYNKRIMLKSFLSCNFFVLLYKQRLSFLFVTPKKIPMLENYENGNLIYRSVKV